VTGRFRVEAILVLVLVAGCDLAVLRDLEISLESGAGPQPPPPNAVDLTFYMRDLSGLPHYYAIRGEHDPDIDGTVTAEPATIGCGPVGRDWELIVVQTGGRPAPGDDPVLSITSEAFGDPDALTLWLSIGADGAAVTGEGVPEWWREDLQRC
jgi:hypothetical protein